MATSPTARIWTALQWLAAAAVFLVTAELFVRVDDAISWNAPLLGPYTEARLMVRDAAGARGRPAYRFQKWRMNEVGFRGPDITESPRLGTFRLVILGASETFGLYETEGSEYPARMQGVLDSLSPGRFEVVNASLPGLMLPTMLPYYEAFVSRIKPHYVLVYPTPSFYLFLDEPKPIPAGRRQAGAVPRGDSRTGTDDPERFTWRLLPKTKDVVKGLVPPSLLNTYREWRLRRIRSRHPATWVWDSVPRDRMAIFAQHLEQLAGAIRASGAEPVLVTHTNRFTGCPACLVGGERRHLVNLMLKDYPRASARVMVAVDSVANDVIRAVARKIGVVVVEAEGRIPPTEANFADYSHFTDAGAELMARILAAGVLQLQQRADSIRPVLPRP